MSVEWWLSFILINLVVRHTSLLAMPTVGVKFSSPPPPKHQPTVLSDSLLKQLARQSTVRITGNNSAGSGVLVQRRGKIYTILTNWHVFDFSPSWVILTVDGRRHPLIGSPKQLGNIDLAIAQFASPFSYGVATISDEPLEEKTVVYAGGFPLYRRDNLKPSLSSGVEGFLFTTGQVSLILSKPLPQGYQIGYTNQVEIGMSGGPIFNAQGLLVGVNGRVKYRDPGFGAYTFADGTVPSPGLLNKMIQSSWGIPISTYRNFTVRSVYQNANEPI